MKDAKKEEKEQMELKELRNQMSAAFLIINAIFIAVVFALQVWTLVFLAHRCIRIDKAYDGLLLS